MMTKEHVHAHVQALRQDLLELALEGVKVGGDITDGNEALRQVRALDRVGLFLLRDRT